MRACCGGEMRAHSGCCMPHACMHAPTAPTVARGGEGFFAFCVGLCREERRSSVLCVGFLCLQCITQIQIPFSVCFLGRQRVSAEWGLFVCWGGAGVVQLGWC